jgi:hypothetical protein
VTRQDLAHAFGRAAESDRPRVRAHLMWRAKERGAEELLPAKWRKG